MGHFVEIVDCMAPRFTAGLIMFIIYNMTSIIFHGILHITPLFSGQSPCHIFDPVRCLVCRIYHLRCGAVFNIGMHKGARGPESQAPYVLPRTAPSCHSGDSGGPTTKRYTSPPLCRCVVSS